MSLKDDVMAVEQYVKEHVDAAKAFIQAEIGKLADALAKLAGQGADTSAIEASLANIKAQMDGLTAVAVEPTEAPPADAAP